MKHLAVVLVLAPLLALAQPTPSPDPADPPSAAAEPSEAPAPEPKPEEKTAEEKKSKSEEALAKLTRLKFSGYVQSRYVHAQTSTQTPGASGTPSITDGFTVRRGRIKATYSPLDHVTLVLQIDAVPGGVSLRDAEAHLAIPVPGAKLALIMGQTKWPFGYEVIVSSSDRELPERSRVVRAFAASERDRGVKLSGAVGPLTLNVGVFDGNGTETRLRNGTRLSSDNDQNKDVVGRVGFDLKWLSGGVSGWYGRTFDPGNAAASPAVPSSGTFDRTRLGADLQLTLSALELGKTSVRLEAIAGKTYWANGAEQYGVSALGWYVVAAQQLGKPFQVAARYDHFDGAAGTPNTGASSRNGIGTFGAVASWLPHEQVKLSAVYEVPVTAVEGGASDPADNLFTLQLQAKY